MSRCKWVDVPPDEIREAVRQLRRQGLARRRPTEATGVFLRRARPDQLAALYETMPCEIAQVERTGTDWPPSYVARLMFRERDLAALLSTFGFGTGLLTRGKLWRILDQFDLEFMGREVRYLRQAIGMPRAWMLARKRS